MNAALIDIATGVGAAYGALFAIVNPLAVTPVFSALSRTYTPAARTSLARRVSFYSFWILVVALAAGRFVLHFFGVSLGALEIAGGGLVVLAGWRIMQMDPLAQTIDATSDDPAFTPLAMPLAAGPGAIGVVLGVSTRGDDWRDFPSYTLGIALVALTLYFFLRYGDAVIARLGPSRMRAVNQMVGLLVIAIGAELIMHGWVVTGPVYHSYPGH